MSEDTLSQLLARHIASNLRPLVGWLYAVFAAVITGTATLVSLAYGMAGRVSEAQRVAAEAKADAAEGRAEVRTLGSTVVAHSLDIAVLKSLQRGKSEAP